MLTMYTFLFFLLFCLLFFLMSVCLAVIVLVKFLISVVSCFSSLSFPFFFIDPYLIDSFLIAPFINSHRVFGFAFLLIVVISVIIFFIIS